MPSPASDLLPDAGQGRDRLLRFGPHRRRQRALVPRPQPVRPECALSLPATLSIGAHRAGSLTRAGAAAMSEENYSPVRERYAAEWVGWQRRAGGARWSCMSRRSRRSAYFRCRPRCRCRRSRATGSTARARPATGRARGRRAGSRRGRVRDFAGGPGRGRELGADLPAPGPHAAIGAGAGRPASSASCCAATTARLWPSWMTRASSFSCPTRSRRGRPRISVATRCASARSSRCGCASSAAAICCPLDADDLVQQPPGRPCAGRRQPVWLPDHARLRPGLEQPAPGLHSRRLGCAL